MILYWTAVCMILHWEAVWVEVAMRTDILFIHTVTECNVVATGASEILWIESFLKQVDWHCQWSIVKLILSGDKWHRRSAAPLTWWDSKFSKSLIQYLEGWLSHFHSVTEWPSWRFLHFYQIGKQNETFEFSFSKFDIWLSVWAFA